MLRKELIIQNKISRLWDELFEEVPDIVQRESRNKNLLLQSRLREMMQFIENHYKERISSRNAPGVIPYIFLNILTK